MADLFDTYHPSTEEDSFLLPSRESYSMGHAVDQSYNQSRIQFNVFNEFSNIQFRSPDIQLFSQSESSSAMFQDSIAKAYFDLHHGSSQNLANGLFEKGAMHLANYLPYEAPLLLASLSQFDASKWLSLSHFSPTANQESPASTSAHSEGPKHDSTPPPIHPIDESSYHATVTSTSASTIAQDHHSHSDLKLTEITDKPESQQDDPSSSPSYVDSSTLPEQAQAISNNPNWGNDSPQNQQEAQNQQNAQDQQDPPGPSDQVLTGTSNADTLHGGEGNDTLYGLNQSDTLYGGKGNDTLYGGNQNDTLYGEEGNDALYGENHNDYLDGGAGNDILHGGNHDDTLIGGTGDDQLFGESGNDLFIFSPGSGHDAVDGGSGNWVDTIQLDMNVNSITQIDGSNWVLHTDHGDASMQADSGFDSQSGDFDASAQGSIHFADGSTIDFHDIESLHWNGM